MLFLTYYPYRVSFWYSYIYTIWGQRVEETAIGINEFVASIYSLLIFRYMESAIIRRLFLLYKQDKHDIMEVKKRGEYYGRKPNRTAYFYSRVSHCVLWLSFLVRSQKGFGRKRETRKKL